MNRKTVGLLQNKKFRENHAEFFALQVVTGDTERIPDEADHAAAASDVRNSHEDVFSRLKGGLNV